MQRADIIEKRRAFRLPGYKTLTDSDFDGDWVSPHQITSQSVTGPCLVAYPVDASVEAITRYELENRQVIALGDAAASPYRRHGIRAVEVCHPSSRTTGTYVEKAEIIGRALKGARIGRRDPH